MEKDPGPRGTDGGPLEQPENSLRFTSAGSNRQLVVSVRHHYGFDSPPFDLFSFFPGSDPISYFLYFSIFKLFKVDPEKQGVQDRHDPQRQDSRKEQTENDGYGHGFPHRTTSHPERDQATKGGHRRQNNGT